MPANTFFKWTALFICLFYCNFSFSSQQHIPEQCQKLFDISEKLILDAKRQPGTHIQLEQIESKYKQSKEKIINLELEAQIKACNNGLTKLNKQNKAEDSDSN